MTNPKVIGSKSVRRNGRDIRALSKMAHNYPQQSYAAVACVVQSKWIFLQRVKKDTGQVFMVLERVLRETFLNRLLFGKSKTFPPMVGFLSKFPVNKLGMGL